MFPLPPATAAARNSDHRLPCSHPLRWASFHLTAKRLPHITDRLTLQPILRPTTQARQQQEEEKRRKIMGEAIMALDLLPSTQDASKPQPKIDASRCVLGW